MRLGMSTLVMTALRCIFVLVRILGSNEPEKIQLWDEFSADRIVKVAINAVYLIPFQQTDYNFFLQIGLALSTMIAQDCLGLVFRINNAVWPFLLFLIFGKEIFHARSQIAKDVTYFLKENDYKDKLIKVYQEQQVPHGQVIIRLSDEKEPEITRALDSALQIMSKQSEYDAIQCLKETNLLTLAS